MGLFDFFKKKPTEQSSNKHILRPERETLVPLEIITEGSHGDHWASLFGFDKFYQDQQLGEEMLAFLMFKGTKTTLANGYAKQELDYPKLTLKVIQLNGNLISSYPIAKTNYSIPVKTKVIKEWGHSNGVEGQIEARGKDTFGLLFFATDYLENKSQYQNKFDLNIKLTGFAYSVEPPPHMENMAEDFVGYLPNSEYGKFSVLDYVGKILDLKVINETEFGINGYIAKLRLIQMDEDKDFFVVDTFINKENIGISSISVGDRISGMMWLQGQITN
jgi:hypothetical protein